MARYITAESSPYIGTELISEQIVEITREGADRINFAWMIAHASDDQLCAIDPADAADISSALLERSQFFTDLSDLLAGAAARLRKVARSTAS